MIAYYLRMLLPGKTYRAGQVPSSRTRRNLACRSRPLLFWALLKGFNVSYYVLDTVHVHGGVGVPFEVVPKRGSHSQATVSVRPLPDSTRR